MGAVLSVAQNVTSSVSAAPSSVVSAVENIEIKDPATYMEKVDLEKLAEIITDQLSELPKSVEWTRDNILSNMWYNEKIKEEPYECELPGGVSKTFSWKDYEGGTDTIAAEVDDAAVQIACVDSLNEAIGEAVHEIFDDQVSDVFPTTEPIRGLCWKLYESAVEKAVEKIVDETIAQARKMLEEKRENAEMFVPGEEFDGTEMNPNRVPKGK
jgi:hypothetical protein